MKRFFILFIISTLIASVLLQCEKDERVRWTNYTISDGLISNRVYAIAIDAEGNKWFGAWESWSDPEFFPQLDVYGVSKFDGTNWTNYTISDGLVSSYVNAIAIDNVGNKWFGAYGGVSKFDGTNWTTYTTSDGLVTNGVTTIAIDAEGNKWFGSSGGVSKFDGTNWTTYTASDGLVANGVTAIAIDAQGNKWFVAWSLDYDDSPPFYPKLFSGVSKFDGTNWTTYTTSDGRLNEIAIDPQGNKWFGSSGDDEYGCVGVSKFDGINWTNYTTSDGLISNCVYAIAIDKEGNKWFGTDGGVSKFDGTNWTDYTTSDGLVSNLVLSIAIDKEGNKWFGTDMGVSKLSD